MRMMMAAKAEEGVMMMMMMMVAMTKTDVSGLVMLYYSSVLKMKSFSTFLATMGGGNLGGPSRSQALKLPAGSHLSPIRIKRGRC
jgi:hypothetical protein